MVSNFKIIYTMDAMLWRFCVILSNFKFCVFVINIIDIAIITGKNVEYRCNIHNISKFETMNLLENSFLENCEYI